MENNILNNGQIIFNGGNGLKDCPKTYEEANEWTKNANKDSKGSCYNPEWRFDCGFKLDYDWPIVRVGSRFYPPKTHYGQTWRGGVAINIFDKEIIEKRFDCETLEELKKEVESYIDSIKTKLEIFIAEELK